MADQENPDAEPNDESTPAEDSALNETPTGETPTGETPTEETSTDDAAAAEPSDAPVAADAADSDDGTDPSDPPATVDMDGDAEPNSADSTDGTSESAEPESTESGADVAEEEAAIRHELGIGGGKIEIDQAEVEKLLSQAVVGYEQIFAGTVLEANPGRPPTPMEALSGGAQGGGIVSQNLGLLHDVNMRVKVELGRGRMYLKDILRLAQGSVVELERLAGDPLDIFVNEKVIARGEVLVLNENFCIRITEIYSPAEVLAQGA